MSRPEDLRPMSSFYPDRPVLLYDELNHQVFEWAPDRIARGYDVGGVKRDITWLDTWNRCSRPHDKRHGIVE